MRLQSNVREGYYHLKIWPGLESILLRWFTRKLASKLVLAVVEYPYFFTTRVSPPGCLSVLTTWWLASPRISNIRYQAHSPFGLVLEIILSLMIHPTGHTVYCVLHHIFPKTIPRICNLHNLVLVSLK